MADCLLCTSHCIFSKAKKYQKYGEHLHFTIRRVRRKMLLKISFGFFISCIRCALKLSISNRLKKKIILLTLLSSELGTSSQGFCRMWLRVERFHSVISTVLLPFLYFSRLLTRSFISTCIWFIAPAKCGHYSRKQILKSAKKAAVILVNLSACPPCLLWAFQHSGMLTNIMRTCPLLLITNIILQRVWTTIKNTVSLFILKTQWNFRKVLKQRRPLTIDCFVGNSEILGKKATEERPEDGRTSYLDSRIWTSLVAHTKYSIFPIYDNPSM